MKKFSEIEYKRPDFEAFKKETIRVIENIGTAINFEVQKEFINEYYSLKKELDTILNIAAIRNTLDTRDKFYEEESTWIYNILPEFNLLSQIFYKTIVKSPFRLALIKEFGEQLFTIADTEIKAIDERLVEDRKRENKLKTEYSNLMASAKIDWNGEELNLSQLAAYKVSDDRKIRKKAASAIINFLDQNTNELDRIYDEMVHLRDGMAKKIGLNNFIELAYVQMGRIDYDYTMVAKFRNKVLDFIVPLTDKLNKKQANRIGLDNLKHYDEGFKFNKGNATPKGSCEWIINQAQLMFKEISPETDDFFTFMTKYELMDLDTRLGKKMTGYCSVLASHGAPFIFSNSNGTSEDIRVLIHEAGHAFQKYQSGHFKVEEYMWPTMESAEIHSMGMEFFTLPWMDLFFKEDAEKYKFQHIASTLEFLPYAASVDEFQHRVYEKPNLTPAERKEVWRVIEKKYKPNLDYDGNEFAEKGGIWQKQLHIYSNPLAYIEYALAQICALQFWVNMQDDFEGAWKDYLKLCKAGGSMSFLKLLNLANLKSPFEDGVIEEVAAKVEAYLNEVDDSSF